MDNKISNLIQELFPGIVQLSYASIFDHFNFVQKVQVNCNVYSTIGKTYQVYRINEQQYTAFNTSSLRELNKPELLIEICQTNDLQYLQQICRSIKSSEKLNDLNLTKPVSVQEAIGNILALKRIPENFSIGDIPNRVFTQTELSNRFFLRGSQLCFPLSYQDRTVNLGIYAEATNEYYLNRNMVGALSSHYESGSTKFLCFTSGINLLRYCSTHTLSGSLAYLVSEDFPDFRLLEVLQWIHKKGFGEIILPYSQSPWLFALRIYCQLVNIEIPRITLTLEGNAGSSNIAISFKSSDLDFATTYSSFIGELNKTSRQKIKNFMANPATYEEEPFFEKYFLFHSENRALVSKSFKSLTCYNTPTNAQALLQSLLKVWPVNIPLKFHPLV